jgi:4'-phosphopantetheinyl transferase
MKSIRNPHSAFPNRIIYPVILAVPAAVKKLKPKERVEFLRGHARRAVEISAEKCRIPLGELVQDERNAPLPFNGNFWSITHKPQYVGAVVAPSPIGIDIERIDERPESLFQKTASVAEWGLADKTATTFFRYWTAKEAVLKAAGIGLKDLGKCRIIRILNDHHLDLEYGGKKWKVEHRFFNGHIASVIKNGFEIDWTIREHLFQE